MTEPVGEQYGGNREAAHTVGMQLNQYPADSGGSSGASWGDQKDLASRPSEKQAAARAIEDHIEPDAKKAGDWADGETNALVKEFQAKDGDGWLTSRAVKSAHKTWGQQVQNLMNRLASEKAALRATNTVLQSTDLGVGSGVRASSSLDGF